jgi:hypothetical protein
MSEVTRDYSKYMYLPVNPVNHVKPVNQVNPVNHVKPDISHDVVEQADNYCERCGRLNTCSKIYICEIRTDFNGYNLLCDMDILHYRSSRPQEFIDETDSSAESGDESSAEESSEEEEEVVHTKCW